MSEFHVGFTGTRDGMTGRQRRQLSTFLERQRLAMEEHRPSGVTCALHHGDCEGADFEAHALAGEAGWVAVLHPGLDADGESPHRGGAEDAAPDHVWTVHDPLPYAQRNLNIVVGTAMLLACPGGPERRRSGTWSTVRAAERLGRPCVVFMPDGEPVMRGFDEHGH